MIGRRHRDPWWGDEGKGAKRTRRRTQVESLIALALAIGACGLAAAVWLARWHRSRTSSASADPPTPVYHPRSGTVEGDR